MNQAYNILYIDKARKSLARMLDYAVHDLRYDADKFFDLFLSSGVAELFGRGDVRIIAGMSGVELAYHVLKVSGIDAERTSFRYTTGRSKEYWTGWALAQYQWERSVTFTSIAGAVNLNDIIDIMNGYRESEIRKLSEGLDWMETLTVPDHMSANNYNDFSVKLDEKLSQSDKATALKRMRLKCGFSQRRLADVSGIPVRTLQQYEQRQKDIRKAGFEYILKLAAVLNCEPYDLID